MTIDRLWMAAPLMAAMMTAARARQDDEKRQFVAN